MELNFQQYVLLSLINQISGQRGEGTIIGVLRGSQQQNVVLFKNWKGSKLDERYVGLMSDVPEPQVKSLYSSLLEYRLITIAEDKIGDFWLPIIHITNVGKNVLAEKSAMYSSRLERLLEANSVLQDFLSELIPKERKKNTIPGSRRGVAWSEVEDTDLVAQYATQKNIEELAQKFQRSGLSIYCRLRKFELIGIDPNYEKMMRKNTEKKETK